MLSQSKYQRMIESMRMERARKDRMQDRWNEQRIRKLRELEHKVKKCQISKSNCSKRYPANIHSCAHLFENYKEHFCY